MPDRASGFCIYDDPALAVARARIDGLRVLYVDLDVHHGDGVQAIFYDDPGVLTLSFHETGRYLFPGTGEVDELGEGIAAGTSLNVPLQPGTGEGAWLTAIRSLVPEVAAAFGPDLVVSQHGADSHAFDPLAHLRVTTTAMGEVARLVDAVAHRYAGGRWLATGTFLRGTAPGLPRGDCANPGEESAPRALKPALGRIAWA
jgi:acetoin utilization protein AcuC